MTEDAAAIIMLCSRLGFSDGGAELSPLTPKEWNALARKIHESELGHPGSLLGMASVELSRRLLIGGTEADRISALLDRGVAIALELEQLSASGIWCVTRVDDSYPARFKKSLKHQAPPVLFGAGDKSIFDSPAIGIVGSRNLAGDGADFASKLGQICARCSVAVVSGGARGTDRIAMQGALDTGGCAVGVMADSLARTIRQQEVRSFIADGRLVLLTPYLPNHGFSIGAAMGRNRIIYGASDFSVIVASDYEKGGTWAGAVEALMAGWCQLFVRADEGISRGNQELLGKGARPILSKDLLDIDNIFDWMKERSGSHPRQEMLSFA
jgi:predicted Rossmann fold nucleotide-binding protein DprA/Smf involved in DNA uptake